MNANAGQHARLPAVTPLWASLAVTFFASIGTGVFWHAIPFIAKHNYDFGQLRNFTLYIVMGLTYAAGAYKAGDVSRFLERWLSARAFLFTVVLSQAVLCLLPILVEAEWGLWVAAIAVQFTFALMWPVVESYITAGRHGPAMRSAIGWFNLVWMPTVALPMFLIAPIIEEHANWAIAGQTIANVLALAPLAYFARRPGVHDPDVAGANVSAEYPMLLRSARVLLPMSYLLNAAMSPILPYRFEQLRAEMEFSIQMETPAAATWMVCRVLAMLVMWRVGFWHGRWGTLLLGGVTMTGGFGLVVLAPDLWWLLAGLAVLGVGLGMVYYAALYYAMSVGHAEVDAGGTHEALIGTGYSLGPLAGLLGSAIGGGAAIVGIVWALVGVGAVSAIHPYRRARRLRRRD